LHAGREAVTAAGIPLGNATGLDALTFATDVLGERNMKAWHKPEVTEQEVGLEVTTYLPAELDTD
jgi:coenzyme PQQ precursor peptide PqqA